MITVALNHLSVFPTWIQQTVLLLCGLVFIAALAAWLMRIVQTPALKTFLRSLGSLSIRAGIYLAKQMDDPIERPGVERIVQYSNVAIAYLMSGLLVLIAVSFTVLWAFVHERISFVNTLVLFGYIFLCWFVAAVLKAQGGRERVKL